MKSIFDDNTRAEILQRIAQIDTNQMNLRPNWGRMNLFQMLRHNTYWNKWMLGDGDFQYRQALIGKLFGKMALRKMIKDDQPFDQNIPTSKQFQISEKQGDPAAEKLAWMSLTAAFDSFHNPTFVHDFFGKMSREQIGILVYKHSDHHLRQFNY